MDTPFPKNFRRVSGQIYAGGIPDQAFLTFFKNTLGGKSVVSLDAEIGQQIDGIVKSLKMIHTIIPIDGGISTLTDSIKLLIRQIKAGLFDNNQPVYVHCVHGSDRTGFAIALYRTIKQNWNCDSAISEGFRWGYGNGIGPKVQSLWKSLVCAKGTDLPPAAADAQAALDDDIVETMRDDFEQGNVPPAFAPQESWAPDIDRQQVSDSKARRRLRRKMLSDLNDDNIPLIGQHSNVGAIGGAGAVGNYGILQLI